MEFKTIIEPFRIKSVEPIRWTTQEERETAFPRRVYSQSHVDYLGEVLLYINEIRQRIGGVQIVEGPDVLRHFSVRCEPVHGVLIA